MPLDPYSLCPGGREKKIRFCCPDMVKEIEQIERLLESNQSGSCLTFIESLEKDHPDCACLIAAKLSVYRTENRWNEAAELAKVFLEKEPDNPVAAAEYALALAVTGELKPAMSVLVDAFERSREGTAHSSLINAALQVGACLLMQGNVIPVVAIGNRLKTFPMAQEPANALLYQASSLVEMPLLLRDMMFDQYCPDHFPAKADFEDAIEMLALMQWKKGLAKLESLTQYADAWPNIWRDIAAVRFWLLEDEAGSEALKTFASLSNTPLEDAVDAESTRLFMTTDALGDLTDILFIEQPVSDAEKVGEILLSTPRFHAIDFDARSFQERNVPPPRNAFILLDRPFAPQETELKIDNVSSQLATCLFFGKETDRQARLEIMDLLVDDRETVEKLLRETLGDFLVSENVRTETVQSVPKTQAIIQYRFRYTPETMPSLEKRHELERDYYDKIFTPLWFDMPLGLLDGKTPNQAAPDAGYRIRLLGAIQMLEYWMNEEMGLDVAEDLRRKLALPIQGPIPVPDGDEEEKLAVLDDLPVWRWYRLDIEKLPTRALAEGIQIVAVMKEPRATARFAREILNRPMNDMPMPVRILAFESLVGIARGNGDLEDALLWIDRARNEAAENKISDAGWSLHEIPIRLSLRQLDKAHELINDLVKRHGHDEKVMQALQQLFIRLGLLNPDGTPSAAMRQRTAAVAAAGTSSEVAGLWTPDGAAAPTDEAPSKLWTPD